MTIISQSVSWCFEPSQPQRVTSGLYTNFTLYPSYSFHKPSYHKSCFFYCCCFLLLLLLLLFLFLAYFIFRGHSTRNSTRHSTRHSTRAPASGRVTYFILRTYTVERTCKAKIRLGEQSENAENCWENLWNEIQLKGP